MTILRRGLSLAVLLIFSPAAFAAPASPNTRVSVTVRHASLARFLDAVSNQGKVNFILAEGLEEQKVTASLHDVTVLEALDVLKQLKGIEYKKIGDSDTFLVAAKGGDRLASPAVVGAGPELEQKVTINVKGVTLAQFLEALSDQTHVNFGLDEASADKRVTAFLQNVTAREALEVVMTIKGLTCRRLQGKPAYKIESQDAALKDKLDVLKAGDHVRMGRVSP